MPKVFPKNVMMIIWTDKQKVIPRKKGCGITGCHLFFLFFDFFYRPWLTCAKSFQLNHLSLKQTQAKIVLLGRLKFRTRNGTIVCGYFQMPGVTIINFKSPAIKSCQINFFSERNAILSSTRNYSYHFRISFIAHKSELTSARLKSCGWSKTNHAE